MKGRHRIEVRNNQCVYQFELERNISVIRGMSATGKTTLIQMIQSYEQFGPSSGITLRCDKACVVLDHRQWQLILSGIKDSIVFIDEGHDFVSTAEFATAIRESDNYYVIISRQNLFHLPISVEAIYGIKGRKYFHLEKTYHSLFRLYPPNPSIEFKPLRIITEDSNTGFEFFQHLATQLGISCVPAGGNSRLLDFVRQLDAEPGVLIADGAAFGTYMEMISGYLNRKQLYLYVPESFEWLILASGLIRDDRELREIISDPAAHIESSQFFSWERYFTALLVEKTKGTWLAYHKGKLNPVYTQNHETREILKNTPLASWLLPDSPQDHQ